MCQHEQHETSSMMAIRTKQTLVMFPKAYRRGDGEMFSVGLVGCGRWGKVHLGVLQQLQREGLVRRVSVCDVDPAQLKGFVVDALYTHINDMVEGEDLDAVALVTPADNHLELLQLVLNKGLPVLVEKPLSNDHQAAIDALQTLPKHTIMLVGYLLRHHPGVLRLKSAIEDEALSGIEVVAYVRRTTRPQPEGADALTSLAVHGLDTVAWLLDEALMDMEVVYMDRHHSNTLLRLQDKHGRRAIVDTAWGATEEVRKVAVHTSTNGASLDFGQGELSWHLGQEGEAESVVEHYAGQALEQEWRVFLEMVKVNEPKVVPCVQDLLDQSAWMKNHG